MKDTYLAYVMEQKLENEIIIFTLTCLNALKVCLFLRKLGYRAVTINGQMSQNKRLGSLARFKQRDANVLCRRNSKSLTFNRKKNRLISTKSRR